MAEKSHMVEGERSQVVEGVVKYHAAVEVQSIHYCLSEVGVRVHSSLQGGLVARCHLVFRSLEVQIFFLELELKTLYVVPGVGGRVHSDHQVVGVSVHFAPLGEEAGAHCALLEEQAAGVLKLKIVPAKNHC